MCLRVSVCVICYTKPVGGQTRRSTRRTAQPTPLRNSEESESVSRAELERTYPVGRLPEDPFVKGVIKSDVNTHTHTRTHAQRHTHTRTHERTNTQLQHTHTHSRAHTLTKHKHNIYLPSIYLSLSIDLSIDLSIFQSIYLSIYLSYSIYLLIYLF